MIRTYDEYRTMVEHALVPMLDSLGEIPEPLRQAMAYSLEAGGKRLRPVMLLAANEMAGGQEEVALPFACALEMIHTYSLIHDDLPAMDNDDLRRGKPTNHKVFGENMMTVSAMRIGDLRGVRAMEIIMRHAGVTGMIAGQTKDVTSDGKTPDEALVTYIHTHKTADMLEAAVEAGLALAGANDKDIRNGHEYALHLGLAFQMTDDLLDVTGDAAVMGKNPHMDENKMTWVALRGIADTRQDAEEQIRLAREALDRMKWDTAFFAQIADGILERNQ